MKLKYFIGAAGLLFVVAAFIAFPAATFTASVRGANLWWNIVLPAQLPFFIAAELLAGLGVVRCLGVLFEPLMRPLFRVPGAGGFILAMSLAAGFPAGAKLTVEYYENQQLSREEGERLLSFASTAGPLFLSGAVATGMLGWPQAGLGIMLAHYLSCLFTGLVMRFYKPGAPPSAPPAGRGSILARGARALIEGRRQDGRSIGRLLSEAVGKSFDSLTAIAGFIIIFSVLSELLAASGLLNWAAAVCSIPKQTLTLVAASALEVTNGCRGIAEAALPLSVKIIAISAAIAWSGLAVQGQAASFASRTDLSLRPYVAARGLQSCLAAASVGLFLWLGWLPPLPAAAVAWGNSPLARKYMLSLAALAATLATLAVAGLGTASMAWFCRLRLAIFRVGQRKS